MSYLFSPISLRDLTLANRAWVSPMCQYSAVNGVVGDWHLAHHGALATGRPGLIMTEACSVNPEGRISPACPGIWNEEQIVAWHRVVDLVHSMGTPIGIQLAHAGRKGSSKIPWLGNGTVDIADGGWETVGPSAIAFAGHSMPRAMTIEDIAAVIDDFIAAARRALAAGFDAVEIHMAHGYLMHEFLSPLSNRRTDEFGGSLENRMRLPLAVARAVRETWPQERPVFVRISSTDWVDGGWNVDESIELVRALTDLGVDLVDVSSGGLHADQQIPDRIDYQIAYAAQVKAATDMTISAVGRISEPAQAEALIAEGAVDGVFMARAMLRDPHWPLRAARELGQDISWVPQYERARQ